MRAKYKLKTIAFDPREANQFSMDAIAHGVDMLEVIQSAKNMNGPMQDVDIFMRDKMIFHNGNPVFRWMMSNVIPNYSKGGKYVMPARKFAHLKIDGPVALMMGLQVAMTQPAALTAESIRPLAL